jgi:hypothetical protein
MKGKIYTYTGKLINPMDPDPKAICIEDIAHALSNICRWTGHSRWFYSVAQHSVHVASYVTAKNKLWALLHDATEAYLCDIATPVKEAAGMEAYREAEKTMMWIIKKKIWVERRCAGRGKRDGYANPESRSGTTDGIKQRI